MQSAQDDAILAVAQAEDRVLVSADTDFGTLLARTSATRPSIVIFRRMTDRRPAAQAALLLANLAAIADALDEGSVVVIEQARLRVRALPIIE